jgi:propanol-preferring alcohol dehydrogenase
MIGDAAAMKAMILKGISLIQENSRPLERVEFPVLDPGAGQLLIQVSACGVCRIELDEIEGRTPPPRRHGAKVLRME